LFNVETDIGRIYYLQRRSKVVIAVVDNKLLVRLMMEGRCVGNIVGVKEMAMYVCWGDIRGWDEWDEQLCEWKYEMR